MSTRIIFLRHAETKKDPNIHAAEWMLSEEGERQASRVSEIPIMNEADFLYSSNEKKAFLTVEPLAKKLTKTIQQFSFFDEVVRGEKFLTKEEFEQEKSRQLQDLDYKAFNGESGNDALVRFKEGVKKISGENPGRTSLIVSHGTILNIYFADLLSMQELLPERWNKTKFCAYGVVSDGKVLKDIITESEE